MDNKYIKIIKGTPLFQGMSDEEIEKMQEYAWEARFLK